MNSLFPFPAGTWSFECQMHGHFVAGIVGFYQVDACEDNEEEQFDGDERTYYIAAVEREWDYSPVKPPGRYVNIIDPLTTSRKPENISFLLDSFMTLKMLQQLLLFLGRVTKEIFFPSLMQKCIQPKQLITSTAKHIKIYDKISRDYASNVSEFIIPHPEKD